MSRNNIFNEVFDRDNECSWCDNDRFYPPTPPPPPPMPMAPRYIDSEIPMQIPLPRVERIRVPMPYYIPIPRPVIYRRRIVPQYVRYPVRQIVPEVRPHYMPYDCHMIRTEFGGFEHPHYEGRGMSSYEILH